jgi:NAD(P)-dependent dehydrogenase (short-subunit alcohol dehydrogenase family)
VHSSPCTFAVTATEGPFRPESIVTTEGRPIVSARRASIRIRPVLRCTDAPSPVVGYRAPRWRAAGYTGAIIGGGIVSTVLVTGANRGIGLAFAKALRKRGDNVVATARDPAAATELAETGCRVEECDVTDDASVQALAERLAGVPIDLLVHNAGIMRRDRLDSVDMAAVTRQIDVNALGALRVTIALLTNLREAENPKVVAMTSRMGSIEDNNSGGFYGYRMSKGALNAIVKSLSIDLAPWPVASIHPGYVRTRMTGNQGDLSPEEAVDRMLVVIDKLDRTMSGKFYHRDGYELPW